jgi:hypothetical protein
MLSQRIVRSTLTNRQLTLTVAIAALTAIGAGASEPFDPNPEPIETVIAATDTRTYLSAEADGPESGANAVRQGRQSMKEAREQEKRDEEARAARAAASVDTTVTRSSSADRAPGTLPDAAPEYQVPTPKDPSHRTRLKSRSVIEHDSSTGGSTVVE